jgi:hypothetical protein
MPRQNNGEKYQIDQVMKVQQQFDEYSKGIGLFQTGLQGTMIMKYSSSSRSLIVLWPSKILHKTSKRTNE